jgi:hypothetical protein
VTDRSEPQHDEEREVDEAEQLEAERLARALDERAESAVPEDALEAALLLRVLADGELSDARADELEAEVLQSVRVRPPQRALVWSTLSAALGLAALVLVLWFDRRQPPLVRLPEPSVDLLAAQAALLSGEPSVEYPRQMAAYRQEALVALRAGSGAGQ